MIKLSDRLQLIANLIEVGQTVADIGTDHGFLPIFLWESKKSPKVILADISKGSLQKAIDNVEQRGYKELQKNFIFKLGNGIQILEDGEVDSVVIAGMGGVLMTDILGENLTKTSSFKKIILQPRNGQGKLRWWLLNNGFNIKSENLVREGKFICEIIEVEPPKIVEKQIKLPQEEENIVGFEVEDAKYELPESILISNGALAAEFAQKKLEIEKNILENMKKSLELNSDKHKNQQNRINYLENLIEKYKMR